MRNRVPLVALALFCASAWLALAPGAAASRWQPAASAPCEAQALVRQTVANELSAADADGHYMYRLTEKTPHGSSTEEVIETASWLVAREVEKNGHPLSADEQRKEDNQLRKLLTDPDERKKLEDDAHDSEDRTRRIVQALPHAFIYQCAGTDTSDTGQPEIHLTFKPNPDYDPPSRDLKVLTGMEGNLLIDPTVKRLVRVEARLVRDVDFGWGIFGRLYRGGHFIVEQRAVGDARWAITTLDLHFDGRVFLFKGLHINSVTTTTDFRHIPNNVTLEHAVRLLLKEARVASPAVATHPQPH
ncbi:MAG TPA: hypothetical protein VIC33_01805 [Vicinamibacterales bacterium]